MNPHKYAFGVLAGKFLGFIIYGYDIEDDPNRIKAIQNIWALTSKLEMQKFLGKINYLWRFISNLVGKVDAFTPILWLKDNADFTWGGGQSSIMFLILLRNTYLQFQLWKHRRVASLLSYISQTKIKSSELFWFRKAREMSTP
jgi:hypothetical protein